MWGLQGQVVDTKKTTATKEVFILDKEFVFSEISKVSHKIWVYLPPNYYQSTKKYPVIYMHDGQNLFDSATSFIGEWEVDETLNDIYKTTKKGFIVVGIANGGEARLDEYTPWKNEKYGGGKGDYYIKFLINTLKPYIDKQFRTKKQAKHTAIIGSSLGGLISYYGGLQHPNVFGKIGALSTSFWFSDNVYSFTDTVIKSKSSKIYLLVGEKEGHNMVPDTQKIEQMLLKNGFSSKNLKTKVHPKGEHNEAFWKSEFNDVITWLFKI
jgi:alpha-glucosidase